MSDMEHDFDNIKRGAVIEPGYVACITHHDRILLDGHYYSTDEVRAALTRPAGGSERLREALDSIRQYGSDTLSGRMDGPDDRKWQRDAVLEMTRRAEAALASPQGAEQRQECPACNGEREVRVIADGVFAGCVPCPQCEDATPHPAPAATQGDALRAAVESVPPGYFNPGDGHTQRENRTEVANIVAAALSSPPGVQAAQVSDADARSALWALRQILHDLPQNRDWMDPAVEGFARELVKRNPYADLASQQAVKP